MADKLSWDEIRMSYPDEWVILVDFERETPDSAVTGGVVFAHSRNKRELLSSTKEALRGQSRAIRFTGEVGQGNYLF
jgi:hypothetical protein